MKETITIPEGVKEIEISKCSDKVIIEFVPEALKHKFKVGDKVKVKKGFPYEERILTITAVAVTSDHQDYPYLVREVDYVAFPEHAFELFSDKPKIGDWVIYWDKIIDGSKTIARVGILTYIHEDIDNGNRYPYEVDGCFYKEDVLKWDGTKEHLERVRNCITAIEP